MPKRIRKYNFPCLECGPTKWLPTIIGHICPTCQGDADDSDPTEECSMCHGHVWELPPFTSNSIIGPGSTAGRCWRCDGSGRLKKMSVQMAEFDAKLTPEAREKIQEIRNSLKGKKFKLPKGVDGA